MAQVDLEHDAATRGAGQARQAPQIRRPDCALRPSGSAFAATGPERKVSGIASDSKHAWPQQAHHGGQVPAGGLQVSPGERGRLNREADSARCQNGPVLAVTQVEHCRGTGRQSRARLARCGRKPKGTACQSRRVRVADHRAVARGVWHQVVARVVAAAEPAPVTSVA